MNFFYHHDIFISEIEIDPKKDFRYFFFLINIKSKFECIEFYRVKKLSEKVEF